MIIWFKIDKSLCVYKCDVYCAFTYLPPANSVFLKNLNCDIFSELENFLCNYLNQGDVFVFGDLIVERNHYQTLLKMIHYIMIF